MNVRPLYDRVIVKRLEAEEKLLVGSLSPTAKEKPIQGQVIAVGNGKRTDKGEVLALEVSVNDRVLFGGKYSGTEIKLDGEERVILREDEILAIVEA